MEAVVSRTGRAILSVDAKPVSSIPFGLVVYLGVEREDTEADAEFLAKKIFALRIFSDAEGKMNLSVGDVGGEILAVSQFTLLADCTKGNRPSFFAAEEPARANELYKHFAKFLESLGATVKRGVFGADMKIEQLCDGPVTIELSSRTPRR